MITKVGDKCLIMSHSHIGHDCTIGKEEYCSCCD